MGRRWSLCFARFLTWLADYDMLSEERAKEILQEILQILKKHEEV